MLASRRAAGVEWQFTDEVSELALAGALGEHLASLAADQVQRLVGARSPALPERPRVLIGAMSAVRMRPLLERLGVDWGASPEPAERRSGAGRSSERRSSEDEELEPRPADEGGQRASAGQATGPSYLDRRLDPASDVLLAVFEDPDRPGLPLTLIAGQPDWIAPLIPDLRAGSLPALTLLRAGVPVLQVRLELGGRARSASLVETQARWSSDPGAYRGQLDARLGLAVQVDRTLPTATIGSYLERLAAARERAARWIPAWLAGPAEGPLLQLESQVQRVPGEWRDEPLGDWQVQRAAADGTILQDRARALLRARATASGAWIDDGGASWLRAAMERALGRPRLAWISEAAAVDAADHWWGRELEAWCAHLVRAGVRPGLAQLLAPDAKARLSPHLVVPLRALLFRLLRQQALESGGASTGPEGLARLWSGAEPLAELETLERWWLDRLGEALERHPEASTGGGLGPDSRAYGARLGLPLGPSDEGAGSAAAERALTALRAARAELVALDAFLLSGPVEDGQVLQPDWRLALMGGDAALAASVGFAQRAGLRVALVAQLLPGSHGTHLADLKKTTGAEWEAFFETLEPLLVHLALCAELLDVDLLCLGSGLLDALRTLPRTEPGAPPEDEQERTSREVKRLAWARLLPRVRALYSGSLAAQALDLQSAAAVGLWPDLDYVGIGFQPPAGSPDGLGPGRVGPVSERRTSSRMVGLLSSMSEFAAAQGRPLLLAGAGFRATSAAWRGRYGGAGGEPSRAQQARLLEALASALERLRPEGLAPALAWLDRWDCAPPGQGGRSLRLDLPDSLAKRAIERLFKLD